MGQGHLPVLQLRVSFTSDREFHHAGHSGHPHRGRKGLGWGASFWLLSPLAVGVEDCSLDCKGASEHRQKVDPAVICEPEFGSNV